MHAGGNSAVGESVLQAESTNAERSEAEDSNLGEAMEMEAEEAMLASAATNAGNRGNSVEVGTKVSNAVRSRGS